MHEQIHKYIEGKLSQHEIDQLWMNVLRKPVWYDYFITELTAKKKLLKSSDGNVRIDEKILSYLPDIFEESSAGK